jgi:hypothetical protein
MKFSDNFPSWSTTCISLMNIILSFIQVMYISDLFLNLMCWFPHIISCLIVLKFWSCNGLVF